jgi:hypothetical protein
LALPQQSRARRAWSEARSRLWSFELGAEALDVMIAEVGNLDRQLTAV